MQAIGSWRLLLGRLAVAVAALGSAFVASAQDIVVGQIGPWTVIPVPDAPQVNAGLKAHFTQVNARGGINGRRISLFELDDAYSADTFVQRFEEAMKRKPVALLTPIGSQAIKRMLDDKLLDRHDVVVLNAIPGAESLRAPGHPRFFHIRAGDRRQVEKMVQHARTLGITRMTVLYETIEIGRSAMAVAQAEVDKAGGVALRGVSAPREAKALAAAAQQIAATDTQNVLVLGSPRFNVDAIAELRKAGVSPSIFTFSYVPPGLLAKVAGSEAARGIGIAQTFPNPMGVNTPLQREFQAAMKAAFPQVTSYTSFHIEGYITARVLTEALRRAPQVTPEAMARTMHAMGEIDLGGYRVRFGEGNTGSNFVDISVMTTGGRLMY